MSSMCESILQRRLPRFSCFVSSTVRTIKRLWNRGRSLPGSNRYQIAIQTKHMRWMSETTSFLQYTRRTPTNYKVLAVNNKPHSTDRSILHETQSSGCTNKNIIVGCTLIFRYLNCWTFLAVWSSELFPRKAFHICLWILNESSLVLIPRSGNSMSWNTLHILITSLKVLITKADSRLTSNEIYECFNSIWISMCAIFTYSLLMKWLLNYSLWKYSNDANPNIIL